VWIIGGYQKGNRNDVWFSSNGVEWQEAVSDEIWPIRHEPGCLSYQGKLWLLGGYGERLYNDVWAFELQQ
jgi:hypothetical protein